MFSLKASGSPSAVHAPPSSKSGGKGMNAEMQIPRPHARPTEPGSLTVGPGNLHSHKVPQGWFFFPLNFYFLIFWLWHMACGIVPHPRPQLWKFRVLTTRPQGISPPQGFLMDIYIKNSFPYLGAVNMFTFENSWRDCPGSPVVKYSPFNAGDSGSIPCWEIKIPCALW